MWVVKGSLGFPSPPLSLPLGGGGRAEKTRRGPQIDTHGQYQDEPELWIRAIHCLAAIGCKNPEFLSNMRTGVFSVLFLLGLVLACPAEFISG